MENATRTTGICCLALSLALTGKVSFPGSPTYTASLASYFSLQEAALHPTCIVSPQTAQDVSRVVSILTTTITSTIPDLDSQASPRGCKFAVRSGGHASLAGAANMAGGVTIDLSGLSSITLSPLPRGVSATQLHAGAPPTLSVGVGSTWGSVYTHLDRFHLGVSGGRAGSVGVGGLTLGGGISYFGPRFGWTCDSVTNFEVVLANGTIVNANGDENPDLLWALRGGMNNFGIVTRINLQTLPQGDLWGGQVVRPFETVEEQITALAAFNDPETYDEFASLITTFAYSGAQKTRVVVNNMEYTKPVANPPIFHTLTSMAELSSTQRITNMSDLATETDANNPRGFRQASATLTIVSSIAAINATVVAWNASIASICDIPGIVWAVGMDPLPPFLYQTHADANALGLAGRKGRTLIIVNLSIAWNNSVDDDTVGKAARALVTTIERDVEALGALDRFRYVNYAAPWQQPIQGYGEASLSRMKAIRKAYDPMLVLTDLVPGGFKIPK